VTLKRYQPAHPAISTGLCGSITTFSSWQLGIFNELANYNAYPHTRGKNILAGLSEFLVTIAMSLNGLIFGQHLGEALQGQLDRLKIITSELKVIPREFSTCYLSKQDYMTIAFGICSWLGVIFAAIFSQSQKDLALACVFAPIGALARWYLSFYNGRLSHFPIGTFIANVFGTVVLAVLALLQSGVYLVPIACDVVQGLQNGFCGCLTTVSTFMVISA
jgi:CrcB protein